MNRKSGRIAILYIILIMLSICGDSNTQRSVGGRGVLRRNYTGKKPVLIQHRTPDAVNYYDHENGAKIIKSSHFELDYTLGRKITFFCMAQGNPRPTITWFKDGAELYQHRFFQVLLTYTGIRDIAAASLTVAFADECDVDVDADADVDDDGNNDKWLVG
ncbi:uncharacterized protein LOC119679688 [Teleopsis dalmanni]|uniref:uncharacterized protein LOC119679688 n=1 Tax=Teleopsis dalmanni TaxID=139649 RepID=UPI0018CF984B|nr:uncharacterized protein LOC119679688 [Teleopsis dalmanni]